MQQLLHPIENKTTSVEDRTTTDHLVVVFGPQTALAKHLLASDWASESHLLLVARNGEEAAILSSYYPRTEVVTGDKAELQWSTPSTARAATFVLCAFGLIHPAVPNWTSHATAMSRDIKTITNLIKQCRARTINVILVSTVLAAAPSRNRAYYVGWKYLSEMIVESVIAKHRDVRFCVLLPGRLVERRTLAQPLSLLHTSYAALTHTIIETARIPKTRRQVIGLDARALMMIRGLRLMVDGVLGRST
jgi:hypothetical protein